MQNVWELYLYVSYSILLDPKSWVLKQLDAVSKIEGILFQLTAMKQTLIT